MAKYPRPNYTQREVRALVERFEVWKELVDTKPSRVQLLCRLIDVGNAIRRLGPHEYQAVLLVGLIGLEFREACLLLGVSHVTVWERYQRALERLTTDLNGGDPTE